MLFKSRFICEFILENVLSHASSVEKGLLSLLICKSIILSIQEKSRSSATVVTSDSVRAAISKRTVNYTSKRLIGF